MPDENTLLVVNRSSSRARELNVEAVLEILGRGGFRILPFVADDFDALEQQARDALSPSHRFLIVAGGDGTVSGFVPLALDAELSLGVIPCGTANDFATSLGLVAASVEDSTARLTVGSLRRIDVGEVNGIAFLNAVGIGIGTEITQQLDDDEKRRMGVLAYARELWRAATRRKLLRLKLSCDDVEFRHKVYQVTIMNGLRYGGGLSAPTDARCDDGLLHVLAIGPQSLLGLLGLLPKFLTGRLEGDGRRLHVWDCTRLDLAMQPPSEVTVDGELRTTTPCEAAVRAGALSVLVPEAPAAAG